MISNTLNTMGSGAQSELANILAGPAGDFIYFGLGILILSIGILAFRKFGGQAR